MHNRTIIPVFMKNSCRILIPLLHLAFSTFFRIQIFFQLLSYMHKCNECKDSFLHITTIEGNGYVVPSCLWVEINSIQNSMEEFFDKSDNFRSVTANKWPFHVGRKCFKIGLWCKLRRHFTGKKKALHLFTILAYVMHSVRFVLILLSLSIYNSDEIRFSEYAVHSSGFR